MRRISKKTWTILAAVAVVILLVVAFAGCSAPRSRSEADFRGSPASVVGCYPPLACGPSYAGYVPPYYLAHPSLTYLSPYSAFYAPVFNGRSYTVSRTPAGRAPVTARPSMPYPTGYKPVPGDFRPPTAPKAPVPAPKTPAKAPVKAPAKAPAPKTSRK